MLAATPPAESAIAPSPVPVATTSSSAAVSAFARRGRHHGRCRGARFAATAMVIRDPLSVTVNDVMAVPAPAAVWMY